VRVSDTYAADGLPPRQKVRSSDTYAADGVSSRPKVRVSDTYAADGLPPRQKVRSSDTYAADGVSSRPKVRFSDTYAADSGQWAMDNGDNSGATSGGPPSTLPSPPTSVLARPRFQGSGPWSPRGVGPGLAGL